MRPRDSPGPLPFEESRRSEAGAQPGAPADPRQVSFVLRRMHLQGRLFAARKGRPYLEALYSRQRRE